MWQNFLCLLFFVLCRIMMRPHELAMLMGGNTRTVAGSDLGRGLVDLFHSYYQSHLPDGTISADGTQTIRIGRDSDSAVDGTESGPQANPLFAVFASRHQLVVVNRTDAKKAKQVKKWLVQKGGLVELKTKYDDYEQLDRACLFQALCKRATNKGMMKNTTGQISGQKRKVYEVKGLLRGISASKLLRDAQIPTTTMKETSYVKEMKKAINKLLKQSDITDYMIPLDSAASEKGEEKKKKKKHSKKHSKKHIKKSRVSITDSEDDDIVPDRPVCVYSPSEAEREVTRALFKEGHMKTPEDPEFLRNMPPTPGKDYQ